MELSPTGIELVAVGANGRPWWQLRAQDLQAWIGRLLPGATEDYVSGVHVIGNAWDGTSDIVLEGDIVKAELLNGLLCRMQDELVELSVSGVNLPDAGSLRCCRYGYSEGFAVDVDFGDFVLPLGFYPWNLSPDRFCEDATVGAMIKLLTYAAANRDRIVKREHRFRHALVGAVEKVGHGAAPV
jgi:hypothetical protein